jgi:predicted nuclease of predicted toxin-antitoxin system
VKFLVDNQLLAALAVYLRKKGMDCEHVLDAGLAEASDADLCEYAAGNERIIEIR